MPDFDKTFIVETNASYNSIGVVLMQEGQPIAYLSKALSPRNLCLSMYEKELLSVLFDSTEMENLSAREEVCDKNGP